VLLKIEGFDCRSSQSISCKPYRWIPSGQYRPATPAINGLRDETDRDCPRRFGAVHRIEADFA